MKSSVFAINALGAVLIASISWFGPAIAGPIDIVVGPASQANDHSCQSYSLAIAISLNPKSPIVAQSTSELRELELRLRQAIEESAVAQKRDPTDVKHLDWTFAVNKVTSGSLLMKEKVFTDYDSAMHFVAEKTGITNPSHLGTALSVGLVKAPVLMSFNRVQGSRYKSSHIVTVLGIELPTQSSVLPKNDKLLLLNSAIKWGAKEARFCVQDNLSDDDKYRASVSLTDDYEAYKQADGWHIEYLEAK